MTKTELIKFRVSKENKEKIRDYFGSFSNMRDYILEVIESKGEDVKNEGEQ
jgi:hypothetical protein